MNDRLVLLRCLVELRPQSAEEPDDHRSLPPHIAVAQGPSSTLGIVKFLAEKLSKSVLLKDAGGMLPVRIAAASDAPLDVLYYLAVHQVTGIDLRRQSSSHRPRPPPAAQTPEAELDELSQL